MNLLDAVNEMGSLNNPNADTFRMALEEDYHIIVCDKNNYGNVMIKYDYFIEDGMLLIGKLSDSTSKEIVITLEMAAIYDKNIIDMQWPSYLSGKDVFLVDTIGYMHEAKINSGQFTLKTIKAQLKPGELVYFNDIYSVPHVPNHPDTTIFVEDNQDATFVGMDTVKDTIKSVPNTTQTKNKNEADFMILVLPNATKAPHKKIYEWLDKKTKDIPVVVDTLKKKNMAYSKPHKILLYWSSNVFMASLFDANGAMYKATSELSEAIASYHKG